MNPYYYNAPIKCAIVALTFKKHESSTNKLKIHMMIYINSKTPDGEFP